MANRKDLLPRLKILKKTYPLLLPVIVVLRNSIQLEYCYGDTDLIFKKDKPHHFLIRINKNLSVKVATSTLVHEYAHALAWIEGSKDHGVEWTMVYRRIKEN